MATVQHRTFPQVSTLLDAINDLRQYAASASNSTHACSSEVVVTAPAATSGSVDSITALTTQLIGVYDFHVCDGIAHNTTGSVSGLSYPTSLAEATGSLNTLKTLWNTHTSGSFSTYHFGTTPESPVSASTATNASTATILANELAAKVGVHVLTQLAYGDGVRKS